ncbi:MAG: NADP-dependent isocitrate dehydrogenase, partial [Planctomycetota bacterium]
MSDPRKIVYTRTDEAPALATASLLPILRAFTAPAGVTVEIADISLAARTLAVWNDRLPPEQRVPDALAELGAWAQTPAANIIKLPNISASIPQLTATIAELQAHGYDIPDYPKEADSEAERAIQARYGRVLGSAVNPVLREGNSDRRVAGPVKAYARKHPHSMGSWSADSKTRVHHMQSGDFYASERSHTLTAADSVDIELVAADGSVTLLKQGLALEVGEVIDAATMDVQALRATIQEAMAAARQDDVLLSLHLKATMMKVSDPIMFGHAVTTVFAPVFAKHATTFRELGVRPANGLGDVYAKIAQLPADQRQAIEEDLAACAAERPRLAMVDSDRGITNLHVPS